VTISYDFTVEGDLLLAKARGTFDTLEKVRAYQMAVIEVFHEHGCRRVICDETELVYRLSIFEIFQAAQTLSELARFAHKAVLVTNPKQMRGATFWETVAKNRGLLVRIVETHEEAQRWMDE